MSQDHKAFPRIARLAGDMVHHNGGTAGRVFAGIADPQADIMRLLDEVLGAEGVYYADLQALDAWLGGLSEDDLMTVTDGEETERIAMLEAAPRMGAASADDFINSIYEHCI